MDLVFPQEKLDCFNSCLRHTVNCGKLRTISGIPCCANVKFKLFTIEAEEVLYKLAISTNADR